MEDLKLEYSKRLKALEVNLTSKDKMDAEKELNLSRPTIDKYLNGSVPKLEIGKMLVQFFTGRVQERINELREMNLV